ncbi:DUF4097 family beta strand repeat protein [Brachybacterium sp. MASK1Z-5]|uniref:DUF4097 family beta strand repeat protein n=1 Tax=Brachybacterium halotolerans TaxID=2795215 RepID=A0ABS1B7L3_9MICO|nr:DUF4097 family beta strand repeat-containing protein [Brachybacterium halotolerans]MBK0330623.1 DUF4097 family beta strand repeat protein [Brachybacterium halotolerans]
MPTAQLPPRPLPEGTGRDRTMRRVLVLLAVVCLVLTAGGLAARSIAAGIEQSRFPEAPAVLAVGSPSSLEVTSSVSDVTVRVSDEVDQVTLALVEQGTDTVPADPAPVKARWVRSTHDGTLRVDVQRPRLEATSNWFDDEDRDLLVLVPPDIAPDLSLAVKADVGNLSAQGALAGLDLRTRTGDVDADGVSASGSVAARTDIGDIDLALDEDGAHEVSARTTTGDVSIALPCCETWDVDARSEEGSTDVDAGIRGEGAALRARTDIGDVSVTRR